MAKGKGVGWLVNVALSVLKHPRRALAVAGALFFLGLASWFWWLPREGFPPVSSPFVLVEVGVGGAEAETIDKEFIVPLNDDLQEAEIGISEIDATSFDNGAVLALSLEEGVDLDTVLSDVDEIITKQDYPEFVFARASTLDLAKADGVHTILLAATNPELDVFELNDDAEAIIGPLEALEEVESASVIKQTTELPGGGLTQTDFSRFGNGQSESGVKTEQAAVIGIISADGVDDIALSEAITPVVEATVTEDGTVFNVGADPALQIEDQISSLFNNLAGGLIAVTVMTLLLIAFKASILTAVFIVLVIAITMLVLLLIGFSINTISLFALVLALGLFVDDATIVVEAGERAARKGDKKRIDFEAVKRIAMASMAGTLTTILVFLPLAFLTGILGEFIRFMPVTISIALVVSLLLSLFILPIGLRYVFRKDNKKRWIVARTLSSWIDKFADFLGNQYRELAKRSKRGIIMAIVGLLISVTFIFAGMAKFALLPFNIFPETNDSNDVIISAVYPPGTSVEEADELAAQADAIIAENLGIEQRSTFYYEGTARSATGLVTLTPYHSRDVSSVDFVASINEDLQEIDGAIIEVSSSSVGPPANEYPYIMQVYSEDTEPALDIAEDLIEFLKGSTVTRQNGTTATIIDARQDSPDTVFRTDGRLFIQVEAQYDATDVTALTLATQELVEDEFTPDVVAGYGLAEDALEFDLGFESDNQDSFGSLLIAMPVAIIAMYILLSIQFGSFLQPLLVFLAIPFSIFGVAYGLDTFGYGISFFTMFGFLGLIGIAVNNTILLVDFANQERRKGLSTVEAIANATKLRLRPLITTTLTTIMALVPLAISDPFWQPLAITIMAGLLASTFLVIVSFPYYYLAVYWLRSRIGRKLRRKKA